MAMTGKDGEDGGETAGSILGISCSSRPRHPPGTGAHRSPFLQPWLASLLRVRRRKGDRPQ